MPIWSDGWSGTSPVGTFPPNQYGLADMIERHCCQAARMAELIPGVLRGLLR